ncbi:MAG: hypothetical protein COC01_08125 [Bacteroidetes bacterium]|nr:MAG: hypothetical protein COC01_08125 [Bacteroidota bacterium]
MDWKLFWDNKAKDTDILNKQVGRVSGSNDALENDVLQKIEEHINQYLKIKNNEVLLDVCCGNGLIINLLKNNCSQIIGIDMAPTMIKNANKELSSGNTTFIEGDAAKISELVNTEIDKAYLYFSFQYFDSYEKGKKVIQEILKVLRPGGLIFIGDIPDRKKLWTFYDTLSKKVKYCIDELRNKNSMGKFWKKEELDRICVECNVKGTYYNQTQELPYSYYRFDYLIEKPNG